MLKRARNSKGFLLTEQIVAIAVGGIIAAGILSSLYAANWLVRTASTDISPTLFGSLAASVSRLEQRLVPPIACDNPETDPDEYITYVLCIETHELPHSPFARPGVALPIIDSSSSVPEYSPERDTNIDYDFVTYSETYGQTDPTAIQTRMGFSQEACWQTRPTDLVRASTPDDDTRRLECWRFIAGNLVAVYYYPNPDDDPPECANKQTDPSLQERPPLEDLILVPPTCWELDIDLGTNPIASDLSAVRWSKRVNENETLYLLSACAEIRSVELLNRSASLVPRCGKFVTDLNGQTVRHPLTGNPLVCPYRAPTWEDKNWDGTEWATTELCGYTGTLEDIARGTHQVAGNAAQFDIQAEGAGIIGHWDFDSDGIMDTTVPVRRPCYNVDGSSPPVGSVPAEDSPLTVEELDVWWVCLTGYLMPPLTVLA